MFLLNASTAVVTDLIFNVYFVIFYFFVVLDVTKYIPILVYLVSLLE